MQWMLSERKSEREKVKKEQKQSSRGLWHIGLYTVLLCITFYCVVAVIVVVVAAATIVYECHETAVTLRVWFSRRPFGTNCTNNWQQQQKQQWHQPPPLTSDNSILLKRPETTDAWWKVTFVICFAVIVLSGGSR